MSEAVVVIDMQRGLFETDPAPHEASEVVARINSITEHARAAGLPVIFVQHVQEQDALVLGSPGWELLPGLKVAEDDARVVKTTPNSFLRTDLDDLLKSKGVTRLHVCGYASEYCVDTSVRGAAALGYSVNIIADAHTTHDKEHLSADAIREHHNRTLSGIKSFGVPITTTTSRAFRKAES